MAAAAGWANELEAGRDSLAGSGRGGRMLVAGVGFTLALVLCGLTGAVATDTLGGAGSGQASAADDQAGLSAYQRLPLAFVANGGQVDRHVRFTAQAGGASFFFTRSEAVASFAKGRRGLALRLRFLGANPERTIVGARQGKGRVNYLVGDDPAKWQTDLPTFGELVYRNLWPGVSMHVRGDGGTLKYEFRVQPGADPSRIRLAYRGQRRLSLGPGGDLRIATALGVLRDTRPVSYQTIGGRRVPVASRFVLGEAGAYSFGLGAHDARHPLVIDPGLVYSTYLGGSGHDYGYDIALDSSGDAFVSGETYSTNFPATPGAFDTSGDSVHADAFVAKLNAGGSALVYATYLGGNNRDGGILDTGVAIAVDGAGSAYVTGRTESTDFPTTPGAVDTTFSGSTDAFVTKLNAAGSAPVYSTYLGGANSVDSGSDIAVDAAGNAHLTGGTQTNFPTTPGAFDTTSNGSDAFVTKLNAAGSALVYSTYLGGGSHDAGLGIALDAAGSAHVTGDTHSTDFPTTPGAFDRSFNGDPSYGDAFVTKLNATGSALLYSTFLGGSLPGGENGAGIAVDAAGAAYVTGYTYSSDFPTTVGAFDTTFNGSSTDAFVTKLNAAGSAPLYSSYLGGSLNEEGTAVAVDGVGNAYVTGWTNSANFPTTAGAFDTSSSGDDAFVTKVNTAGSALLYSTYLGSPTSSDVGRSIAVDGAGSAYVTGVTSSGFPTTPGAFDTSFNGEIGYWDAFATKLDLVAGPLNPPPPPPPPPPLRPPPPPPPAPRPQPAPGPRDTELKYDAKRKTFLINVQYVLRNRSCRNPCPARAEIRTRSGRRLYAVGKLPGDGRVVLGQRRGIKIPRGRKIFFYLPIKVAQLRKVHFKTVRGYRYGETRLRVWLRTPKGEVLTVRDGRIRASIARIKSGALPNLRGIL